MAKIKKPKMTKEEKEAYKKTDEYKYKKYKATSYGFYAGSWLSALLPDGILLGVNWNEWVVSQEDNVKVSIALVLLVLTTIILMYKKAKQEVKFNYLSIVIGFWVATGIVYLLNAILTNIVMILVCASIGLTCSLGLEVPAEMYKEKANALKPLINGTNENALFRAFKKVVGNKKEDKGEPTE